MSLVSRQCRIPAMAMLQHATVSFTSFQTSHLRKWGTFSTASSRDDSECQPPPAQLSSCCRPQCAAS